MIGKLMTLFREPKKRLSFYEARIFFFKHTKSMVERSFRDCSSDTESIREALQALRSLYMNLLNASVEEERARASLGVKNRYAEKAMALIDSIKTDTRTFDRMREMLSQVKEMIKDLNDITPKQAMHMKFFFESHMNAVARQTALLDKMAGALDEKINKGPLKKRSDIQKIFDDIDTLEKRMAEEGEQVEQMPEKAEALRKHLNELMAKHGAADMSGFENEQKRIDALKAEESELLQRITSEFSVIERLLRKYQHKQEDSIVDGFINSYMFNPSAAFLKDRENRIRGIIESAVEMAKKGDIEVEAKKIEAGERALASFEELSSLKKDIDGMRQEIRERGIAIESHWVPKKRFKDSISAEIEIMEKEIENKETEKAHLILDMKSIEKKIEDHKKLLAESLSSMLSMEIEIL